MEAKNLFSLSPVGRPDTQANFWASEWLCPTDEIEVTTIAIDEATMQISLSV